MKSASEIAKIGCYEQDAGVVAIIRAAQIDAAEWMREEVSSLLETFAAIESQAGNKSAAEVNRSLAGIVRSIKLSEA